MITDLEAVLIHNSRVARANAQVAIGEAYAVANRNARVARENAQAAAAARADMMASDEECERLYEEIALLNKSFNNLKLEHDVALELLKECLDALDANGIKLSS